MSAVRTTVLSDHALTRFIERQAPGLSRDAADSILREALVHRVFLRYANSNQQAAVYLLPTLDCRVVIGLEKGDEVVITVLPTEAAATRREIPACPLPPLSEERTALVAQRDRLQRDLAEATACLASVRAQRRAIAAELRTTKVAFDIALTYVEERAALDPDAAHVHGEIVRALRAEAHPKAAPGGPSLPEDQSTQSQSQSTPSK